MVKGALLAVVLGVAPAVALAQSTPAAIVIPPLPPPDRPTFRVNVTASPPLETVLDAVRRELAANPRGADDYGARDNTIVRVDVLPAITRAIRRVQKAQRVRSERQIHANVTAELEAFCLAHDCEAANEGLLRPK